MPVQCEQVDTGGLEAVDGSGRPPTICDSRNTAYPLGSPNPLVAMMLRWISLVPPPIVVAVAAM
jgi:hypothetical protein